MFPLNASCMENVPTFFIGISHTCFANLCFPNFLLDPVHGHQVVLAMLESSMKERQTQRIQLNDAPREAVSLLLDTLLLGLDC